MEGGAHHGPHLRRIPGLDDIQAGALYGRPSPYVGTYLLLRIDDRADGRALDGGEPDNQPRGGADTPDETSITVAFTYRGLEALGVPQASLDSFAPEFRQGMAARAEMLGDVGESGPDHWEKPLGTTDVHVAIAVLCSDEDRLQAVAERARAAHAGFPGRARSASGPLPKGDGKNLVRVQGLHRPTRGRGGAVDSPRILVSGRSRRARSSWGYPDETGELAAHADPGRCLGP